ncbi:CapK related-protein [Candidatus Moduliflexus flocculans]|uniref:CapK related-protein n=1 Tax=Candidatus Moduliflexus flocculans TaxID=1499966 RepID=A0A0S6VQJ9_9BACT|nr:CapK related-protein [Candidatus Moduliflexus flocculans]
MKSLLRHLLKGYQYLRTGKYPSNEKLNILRQQQWLSQEELRVLQAERLRALLRHAHQHVPYYRQILEQAAVVEPNGTIHLEHFSTLPLLDKLTVRKEFERLKSDDLAQRRWTEKKSSGSTGEPVTIIFDQERKDWLLALNSLRNEWTGFPSGAPRVYIIGSQRDLFVGQETHKIRFLRWVQNQTWLNAFKMTTEKMAEYVEIVNRVKPVQIHAYNDCLYEFAKYIEKRGLQIHHPQSIVLVSGVVTPDMRNVIERVFHAPIFNRYGSREVGGMAMECDRHAGLHISAPLLHTEILRPDGTPTAPGEVGEIILTPLLSYAMPLLRYRIGDMGAWAEHPCPCGRTWPLLQDVAGRVPDVFLLKDGSVVPPQYFVYLIGIVLDGSWSRKFQIIQEDYDLIRVLVVLSETEAEPHVTHERHIKELIEKVQFVMGATCEVRIEFVDDIPPLPSGKFRYTICNIPKNA